MYKIDKFNVEVNDQVIPVFERVVTSGNTQVAIGAGSNGLKGGNRKAGSRTAILLTCDGDFYAEVVKDEDTDKPIGVILSGSGDEMLTALRKAAEFTADALFDTETGTDADQDVDDDEEDD